MEKASFTVLTLVTIGLTLPTCACNGDHPSVAPTPLQPAPTITSITISGPHVVLTGSHATYSAVGGGRGTTWSTDNPAVATILSAPDGIGELKALAPGAVTVTARYSGSTATFSVDVRSSSDRPGAANFTITFTPNPVPASDRLCEGFPLPPPTYRYNEVITETGGVGFTVETATLALYDDVGNVIYLDSQPEHYYYAPNSQFVEESCTSLFGRASGYYADSFDGLDDLGNRLGFASSRLRLLPSSGSAPSLRGIFSQPITTAPAIRHRRRIR
jgi:hypothetical protein